MIVLHSLLVSISARRLRWTIRSRATLTVTLMRSLMKQKRVRYSSLARVNVLVVIQALSSLMSNFILWPLPRLVAEKMSSLKTLAAITRFPTLQINLLSVLRV